MNEKLKKQMDELAIQQGNNHANPVIRSMYPSTSRGEMAKQFAQLYSLGFQSCHDIMIKDIHYLVNALNWCKENQGYGINVAVDTAIETVRVKYE